MTTPQQSYYLSPPVQARMIEYCGGFDGRPETATARFIVGDGETVAGLGIPPREAVAHPGALENLCRRGADLFRSLWDNHSALVVLDVDYENIDNVDEAFHHPAATFRKLEPVFNSVEKTLSDYHIQHMALMTGQGYHFAWRIPDGASVEARLQRLAILPPTLEAKYLHDHPLTEDLVPVSKGYDHAGLGLLLEYLTHRVLLRAYAASEIPVVATGLVVGSRGNGREAVSIDLSAYGDPLYLRYTRCAFSLYRKRSLPNLVTVSLPRRQQVLEDMLAARNSLDLAAEFASTATALIPDSAEGTNRLLEEYLASGLRRFHEDFQAFAPDEPASWPSGYDRLDLETLPPCVAWPLSFPNDAVAKPTNIQNISRVLVATGWRPRSVAGLIRSKFERDYNWGINWLNYDAAARADSYVRLYCGLVNAGLDGLRDFNCISHQEKGFCPKPWCGFSLGDFREPLLKALRP